MKTIEQQIADLEIFFDGLRPKFRLAVRRVEPEWCAKYLGTIHISEGEDFSFETVRERFGGGKFYIKIKGKDGRYLGHRTITICGKPFRGMAANKEGEGTCEFGDMSNRRRHHIQR